MPQGCGPKRHEPDESLAKDAGVTGQSTGHRTCGQQQAATVASSTAQSDYASVLRSNSGAAAQLQPPPQREDRAPAPASSGSAVPGLDELPKYLNGIAAELLALLPARYASAALADTAVAAPRFMHDDRVCRASINAEFIAAAGHLLRTVPALAGALDGASAATVRQIMLSPERGADHSHGGGVSAASAMSAPVSSASLAALKPQVQRVPLALALACAPCPSASQPDVFRVGANISVSDNATLAASR